MLLAHCLLQACGTRHGHPVYRVGYNMPAAVCLGDEWHIARWNYCNMEVPDSPPPAKRTCRFVSPRGKQSGGLAVFEILYYVIVIDHFLAYMHIRRGYKKYTRVGDFDPPTHQPTNIYIHCSSLYDAPHVYTFTYLAQHVNFM